MDGKHTFIRRGSIQGNPSHSFHHSIQFDSPCLSLDNICHIENMALPAIGHNVPSVRRLRGMNEVGEVSEEGVWVTNRRLHVNRSGSAGECLDIERDQTGVRQHSVSGTTIWVK
jgi:hypothetical protein